MTATSPEVRVSLLGPLEVTVAGRPMAVGGPGRRALLAALGLGLGTTLSVPELLEAVWDDRPPMTATTKLQGHVCALRQSLARLGGPEAAHTIQTKPPGYVLCRHRATTDLVGFDDLIRRARETRLPDQAAHRAELLTTALGGWRGPSACSDIRSSWMNRMSNSLDERRWRAMEDLAEAQLLLGEHHTVIDAMEAMVRRTPYRERAWEHLMVAHLNRGDVAAAVAVHHRLCRTLVTGLGVTPGPRIARLLDEILGRRPVARR
ncbi:BTAD domain-containing putative transcriptional regulator [Actinoplanes sp. NEAU-A12]|uniref:BTAD domain-containing putative transcriptional regulator n=1 Tax=Actinoplanes sandaracinus TaxID=3045177 RepID=A0ABT6WCN9_9ACTN|nr:BTAD domain-containing putative transcriptional regulator [Actinoplanes sandaracinus]MDI6097442.1 BTAD domain-containing putative transcriptional regulator [Actinoplanes sandaracinus]